MSEQQQPVCAGVCLPFPCTRAPFRRLPSSPKLPPCTCRGRSLSQCVALVLLKRRVSRSRPTQLPRRLSCKPTISGPASVMGTARSSMPKASASAKWRSYPGTGHVSGHRTQAFDPARVPPGCPREARVHRRVEHEEHQREARVAAGDHLSRRSSSLAPRARASGRPRSIP